MTMRRMTFLLLVLLLGSPTGVAAVAQHDDIDDLVESNTAFAFDLYGELRDESDGNLLFSPHSVSEALAMTYAGAEGETATQMAETLGFTLPEPDLHETFGTLNADLVARGAGEGEPAMALHIANGLWVEQTYPISQDYTAQLEQHYGAGVQPTDFINAPEPARQQINGWIAEQTEDRIQDIVPEGAITNGTLLVLANALYFYGGWEEPFVANLTSDDGFFLLDGRSVTVPFMSQWTWLPYARGDGFQVIEFPYARSGFTFTVVLPDSGQFDAVEERFDAAMLDAAIDQLAETGVWVYLPKFEFTFGTISLNTPLQSLGMTDAFDPFGANFSGMVDATAALPPCISEVLHKTFISVDEEGTEAAAATAVLMSPLASPNLADMLEVRIDRPFLFAIRDTQTGTLLFLGRVMDPSVDAESPEPLAPPQGCKGG
jgi:serpin B